MTNCDTSPCHRPLQAAQNHTNSNFHVLCKDFKDYYFFFNTMHSSYFYPQRDRKLDDLSYIFNFICFVINFIHKIKYEFSSQKFL